MNGRAWPYRRCSGGHVACPLEATVVCTLEDGSPSPLQWYACDEPAHRQWDRPGAVVSIEPIGAFFARCFPVCEHGPTKDGRRCEACPGGAEANAAELARLHASAVDGVDLLLRRPVGLWWSNGLEGQPEREMRITCPSTPETRAEAERILESLATYFRERFLR